MFYFAKVLQALGLTVILIEFSRNFPELMSYQVFLFGIAVFATGWIINRFITKKK